MEIGGVHWLSVIDCPDKLSSVIFTQGCNFNCPYCHNKSFINTNIIGSINKDYILGKLRDRKDFIDGVVITGGEPTIHESELVHLVNALKSMGFFVKLDTNGTNPILLDYLIGNGLVDYVAMDIKTCKSDYNKVSNLDLERVWGNIDCSVSLFSSLDVSMWEFRTTCDARIVNIHSIGLLAKYLSKYLRNDLPYKWYLQKATLPCGSPINADDLEQICFKAKKYIPTVCIR